MTGSLTRPSRRFQGSNRQRAQFGRADSKSRLRPSQTSRLRGDTALAAAWRAAKPTAARFLLLRQQRQLWSQAAWAGWSPSRAQPTGRTTGELQGLPAQYIEWPRPNRRRFATKPALSARPNRRKGGDRTGARPRPNRRKPGREAVENVWAREARPNRRNLPLGTENGRLAN